jgi:uncharacterized membrane protein
VDAMWLEIIEALAVGLEIAGVFVLAASALIAITQWIGKLPGAFIGPEEAAERSIRIELGDRVILSLEFLIGADIIHTVKNPSFEELAGLAIIVLIRTILHYSLQKH